MRAIGGVVSVSTEPASTSTTRRRVRYAAVWMPCQDRWMGPKLQNASSGGANRTCTTKVSPTSQSSGRKARQNHSAGTPLSR